MGSDKRLAKNGRRFYRDKVTGRLFTSHKAFREWMMRQAFGDNPSRGPVTDSPLVRKLTGAKLVNPVGGPVVDAQRIAETEGGTVQRTRSGGKLIKGGRSIPEVTAPREPVKPKTNNRHGIRVKRTETGLWRRYQVTADGDRYLSDHANSDEALEGCNPLQDNQPVANRQRIVWQSVKEWRGD